MQPQDRDSSGALETSGPAGGGEAYVLTLVPLDSYEWNEVPVQVRLRGAIRLALRVYGLRCVSVARSSVG